ncbi:acyltransferase family protein [Alteromonas lipotrueae]|uniref:acyltransferase family protein n=1 Tax=Alteromonas lipotrueae TaxID=2803814 RepID=UPI001C47E8A3|nr:acyltransferase family protein [Alteromonas lipotrueae]
MNFRKDINGLRAIAVVAVVLFHFLPGWLPGGFAGVDVFFVISGYLMTGIIFKGLENNNFSVLNFYISRANRIIPPLAILCVALSIFGWYYLTPLDYEPLGKHIASSIGFISNYIYWRESGYFDVNSHEKWLLHTWSLSVEWQFYLVYPLVLIALKRFFSFEIIKIAIILITLTTFITNIFFTYKWPDASYFLLHTRAWEMMAGGIAFLCPLTISEKRKKILEFIGLMLIVYSYLFVTEKNPWPGYFALLPVAGAILIILSQREDSLLTNNYLSQKLGLWSYSIYLWHWPLVVLVYYFSLSIIYTYIGIILSITLGYLSYRYIETIKFDRNYNSLLALVKLKPLLMFFFVAFVGSMIYVQNGFYSLSPAAYQAIHSNAKPSPFRETCHIASYKEPSTSCEYYGREINWAVLGDSHAVEIAYSLAEKLKLSDVGLRHFSFSSCEPSYNQNKDYSECARWYNESVKQILMDKNIENVVLNHRHTFYLFGGDASAYPQAFSSNENEGAAQLIKNLDRLIIDLAYHKKHVYVFYPIPELPRSISQLAGLALLDKKGFDAIVGTDKHWYLERNQFVVNHFDNSNYPKNVHLVKSQDVFCDNEFCYAVKGGVPLYFDDDHPSVLGAKMLVEAMNIQ